MNTNPEPVERYLARLKKSLHGASAEEEEEIISDIRSLIQERLDGVERSQAAVESILQSLGPPEALADAYRMEGMLSQAANSLAPLLLARTALRWAFVGGRGFLTALTVFFGYAVALGFFLTALMKPIFPDRTGLWVGSGTFTFGFMDSRQGGREVLGYWTIPVGILLGLLSFALTSLLARWFFRHHVRASHAKAL